MIEFHEKGHTYKSIDLIENINWVSVTTLVDQFKEPFNALTQASKSSVNKKSKWYGLPVEEILAVWENEKNRAINLGTWYHQERETELLACETIERCGKQIPIIHPIIKDGIKLAPDQQLVEGIYPEHLVYLKTAGLCGQADYVEVVDWVLNIDDYKTNKELKPAFKNWEGGTKRLLSPLVHLDDCDIVKYGLQLSLYMYMILKHNPQFKVGKITIRHIQFEEAGRDKYDNPITKLDHAKNPIVKAVTPIEVPYYKKETELMIDWLKNNPDKVRKKK